MRNPVDIDVTFDFRSDTPPGRDPDQYSATLRRYHRFLWSKPVPNGSLLELSATTAGQYLGHSSHLGDFVLASDSVIPSFRRWKHLQPIIEQVPDTVLDEFQRLGYTIGGMMIFPGNRIDGMQTINGARGFLRQIADRFDLTLESIRRHYLGQVSPLTSTLMRYRDFFELFDDFRGYVDYFLLQDLVTEDYLAVRFFMAFDNFTTSSVPRSLTEYEQYRRLTLEFVEARNRRITAWASEAR
jgi:hypothetical protein